MHIRQSCVPRGSYWGATAKRVCSLTDRASPCLLVVVGFIVVVVVVVAVVSQQKRSGKLRNEHLWATQAAPREHSCPSGGATQHLFNQRLLFCGVPTVLHQIEYIASGHISVQLPVRCFANCTPYASHYHPFRSLRALRQLTVNKTHHPEASAWLRNDCSLS